MKNCANRYSFSMKFRRYFDEKTIEKKFERQYEAVKGRSLLLDRYGRD